MSFYNNSQNHSRNNTNIPPYSTTSPRVNGHQNQSSQNLQRRNANQRQRSRGFLRSISRGFKEIGHAIGSGIDNLLGIPNSNNSNVPSSDPQSSIRNTQTGTSPQFTQQHETASSRGRHSSHTTNNASGYTSPPSSSPRIWNTSLDDLFETFFGRLTNNNRFNRNRQQESYNNFTNFHQQTSREPQEQFNDENLSKDHLKLNSSEISKLQYFLNLEESFEYKFTRLREKILKETDQDLECPICTDDYEKGCSISILPCGHSYHTECIGEWINSLDKEKKTSSCPICRYELGKKCINNFLPFKKYNHNAYLEEEWQRLIRLEKSISEDGVTIILLSTMLEIVIGNALEILSSYDKVFDRSADDILREIKKLESQLDRLLFTFDEMDDLTGHLRERKKVQIQKIQSISNRLKVAKESIF